MNVCDAWIDKVAKILPEECLVRDLVKAKVFSTPFTAHFARKAGNLFECDSLQLIQFLNNNDSSTFCNVYTFFF